MQELQDEVTSLLKVITDDSSAALETMKDPKALTAYLAKEIDVIFVFFRNIYSFLFICHYYYYKSIY